MNAIHKSLNQEANNVEIKFPKLLEMYLLEWRTWDIFEEKEVVAWSLPKIGQINHPEFLRSYALGSGIYFSKLHTI
jgi:hypothetical protein